VLSAGERGQGVQVVEGLRDRVAGCARRDVLVAKLVQALQQDGAR
jgi:hypothetical protein